MNVRTIAFLVTSAGALLIVGAAEMAKKSPVVATEPIPMTYALKDSFINGNGDLQVEVHTNTPRVFVSFVLDMRTLRVTVDPSLLGTYVRLKTTKDEVTSDAEVIVNKESEAKEWNEFIKTNKPPAFEPHYVKPPIELEP